MERWNRRLRDGSLAGVTLFRRKVLPKGLHHLVCEALVRRKDGHYLLTCRALNKPCCVGY